MIVSGGYPVKALQGIWIIKPNLVLLISDICSLSEGSIAISIIHNPNNFIIFANMIMVWVLLQIVLKIQALGPLS
jgi:hypothetical protein